MMKSMSKVGGLSFEYTNHCIRKTCVSSLDSFGFSGKDIMSVTGHRNEVSLQPYLGKPSMAKKHQISNALHAYGHPSLQLDSCADDSHSGLAGLSQIAGAGRDITDENRRCTLSSSQSLVCVESHSQHPVFVSQLAGEVAQIAEQRGHVSEALGPPPPVISSY